MPVYCASTPMDVWNLRLFLEVEDAMKNRMIYCKVFRLAIGKNAFDLVVKDVVLFLAPEIVEHQKSSIDQIFAQNIHLLVGQKQPARLHDVDERIIEKPLIGQLEVNGTRVHLQRRNLLQAIRKIQVAVREI